MSNNKMDVGLHKKMLWWVFWLVAITLPAAAQTVPQPAFETRYLDSKEGATADAAVAMALARNGELLALRQELAAMQALIKQAALRANPSLEVRGGRQIAGPDNTLMVQGELPLELGGRRNARILVARREAAVREKALADRERLLAVEVRGKFGEALANMLRLKLTNELLETAQQGYQLVKARVEEGKTAPLEQNMTLVEVNRLLSQRESDAGKLEIAMLELRNLLGLKPEESLGLSGDFADLPDNLPSLPEATAKAFAERPDLQAMRAMEELAAAQIEQARTEGRFDASLTAGYQRMNSGFPLNGIADGGQLLPIQDEFHFLTFGFTLQLPVRNKNQGAIEAAVANSEAATRRREFAELTVRREVAAAFARYERTVRAREIYRVGVREQAAANLNVMRQTYELGAKSLLDYIAEQRRYLEIENSYIDAQLEVYLARLEVARAAAGPGLVKK